jgi:hypothetical protein
MPKNSTPDPFPPELLTATEHHTAEEKSQFGRMLVAFVLGGFQRAKFTQAIYRRLSNCFHHIAEYSRDGFYATWFADAARQRKWVEHVKANVSTGDPAFTFSDVERLFRAWLAVNEEEVLRVIVGNEARERQAMIVEDIRRDALAGKTHQQFKVVAKSSNVGDFGHSQFILLAADGCCYAVQHIQSNGAWKVGDVFNVPLGKDRLPTWKGMCVEGPERRQDAPPEVVAKFWNEKALIS